MQPPGAAFRSSTHTRLPLRTSNAAQTSELMPLPTMTTSKRSRGRILLVGDRGAGRTAEGQDGEASKARLGAPGAKIGAGEVEAIADLEQHAERHQESEGIHASLVVDQVLDGDEHAVSWQRLVGCADQRLLLLEVPVVQDQAHRDDVGARQWVAEGVPGRGGHGVGQPRRAMAARATGSTTGRSNDVHRRWRWRAATAQDRSAAAPP